MTTENVYSIIQHAAEQWPNDIAIADYEAEITYAQLQAEVEALTKQLQALGLKPGQGLGVMMQNSRTFIIGIFAGLGCGATVMPISHQLKGDELDRSMNALTLHAVLDDKKGPTPKGKEANTIVLGDRTLRYTPTGNSAEEQMAPDLDAAFVRFTSGTTGSSKGVAISHTAVLERTEAAQKGLNLTRDDIVIWVLPMAYHFIVSIVLYLRYGIKMAITRDVLAQTILDCINVHQGTFLYAAPMHYRLLAADRSETQIPSLKRAVSTSSGIPTPISSAFTQRYNLPVAQAYGIIEVGLPIINLHQAEVHPEAIGHALPDYQTVLLDVDGNELAPGNSGQLALRGPGMFDAYLCPNKLRNDVELNGWFLTGDIATIAKDGLITIVGREKSMINIAGNKVFPEEVEDVLASHPNVQASRVRGVAHPIMGEAVHADVVPKTDGSIDKEKLLKYCRARLSSYKVPQYVKFVTELPMTDSGKVAR